MCIECMVIEFHLRRVVRCTFPYKTNASASFGLCHTLDRICSMHNEVATVFVCDPTAIVYNARQRLSIAQIKMRQKEGEEAEANPHK